MMDALHAGLGWPVAGTLLAFSFAGSFITVAFGIGGGAVMLAVLATLLPAAAIIPVHGLVQLGSNVGRAAIMVKYMRLDLLGGFTAGALVGIFFGGTFVVQLQAEWIQIGVGLFILWSILATPPAFLRRSGLVTGVFSSFLTMFFGGTGPFVATYVKAQKLERHAHVASHAMLMTVQHLLKTLAFGFLGFAFSTWAGLIVLLIGFGVLGTLAGRLLLARIDERRFKLALNTILAVLAIRLIYSGASELIFGGPTASG
ncbi:sulfite exporter TauE/SafE family protein [Sulfitobacter sp. SK011]|uniref:sulfite exporter TauE/SafE family protein n=1 Tax=Sulfitobacter sp. SK011 TaxID=1389004 RepID=UPI000E0B5D04|nr:sulfite exporter TauE/SafE family protein [Sulfitobacter sp. SK011]AXI41854.1 sulfite exporter TauE/SafE family protein [Sulfitobacter sp. SK011]